MLGTRYLLKKTTRNILLSLPHLKSCEYLSTYSAAGFEYQKKPGVIDGRAIGRAVQEDVKLKVAELLMHQIVPGLAVVLVGGRVDSSTYVRMKAKACEAVGISSHVYKYDESTTQSEILRTGE